MSDIPLARDILLDLADSLSASNPSEAQIIEMVVNDLMFRKRRKDRAPVKSARMTPAIARTIRVMVANRPEMSAQDIANSLGVNPGRVSEAIAGKW
jgi:hypothetical protein